MNENEETVTLYRVNTDYSKIGGATPVPAVVLRQFEARETPRTYQIVPGSTGAISAGIYTMVLYKRAMRGCTRTPQGAIEVFLANARARARRAQARLEKEREQIRQAEALGVEYEIVSVPEDADFGDGRMSPEAEERKAALSQGRP
jgi:hypothetical protein